MSNDGASGLAEAGEMHERMLAEIIRLRQDCAALHMALGCLAVSAGMCAEPSVHTLQEVARAAAAGKRLIACRPEALQ